MADQRSEIKQKIPFDQYYAECFPDLMRANGTALCSWHDDTNPSLSLKKMVGICHGACKNGDKAKGYDIFDLHQKRYDVDFKTAYGALAKRAGVIISKKRRKRQARIVAEYIYKNLDSNPHHKITRDEDKNFRVLHWDADKNKWVYGLGGTQPILYHEDEVLEAQVVHIAEGEKAADNLRELGFCATTSPFGAGKWKGVCPEGKPPAVLKNKDVIIYADNDEPGRKHAQDIACSLHGFATSVKILTFPGLKEKGDVTDWIEQCLGVPEWALNDLAEATPEWALTPETDKAKKDEAITGPNLTDMGNACRLAAFARGKIKFCGQLGGWHVHDGIKWIQDQCSQVQATAKDMVNSWYSEAVKITDQDRQDAFKKHARKCEATSRISAMIQQLPSEPGISVLPEVFDQDPMVLNCLNGTLDLRTFELKPHNPDDRITRVAPLEYDPDATCPRWEQFILEIMDGDEDQAAYIQRILGYSLTGLTKEQVWFFLWGKGSNGKSVFINAVSEVLGDYAVDTPAATFMERKGDDGPRNDLARLRGRRFVSASEPRGARFDAETIKKVSGDGKITARFLHKEFFEFTPEAKVFVCANNRPEVRDSSEAFWRRIQLIPFSRQFTGEDRDNDLSEKLRAEASGILNWMLEGCRAWQQIGLNAPDKVKLAVEEYRCDADLVGNFLEESCVISLSSFVPISKLYAEYHTYCENSGQHALSRTKFNENLLGRVGVSKGRRGPASNREKVWRGVGLRSETEGNVTHADFSRPTPERSCSACDIPPTACPKPLNDRNAAKCAHYRPLKGEHKR
jgi:putative DNA primase/helicase